MPTFSANLKSRIMADYGSGLGSQFITLLNDLGGDGTGVFTTVTADGVVADSLATDTALPYVRFYNDEGVAYFTLAADADTSWEVYADPASSGTLVETINCASGKYEKLLTDNLAVAYAVKINSGNTFYTLVSTNSAETFRIDNTFSSIPPADQSLSADSQTITLPTGINKVCTTTGARTGIILTAGTVDGQIINLINASANTITFAAAGTSNVADGATTAIAANRAVTLIWDTGSSRWYKTG